MPNIFQNGLFGDGVKRAGRFVKNQKRRIDCQSPRNFQSLTLPARKIQAAFRNFGVVTFVELQNVIVNAGVFRSLNHVGFFDGRIEQRQIFRDRPRAE